MFLFVRQQLSGIRICSDANSTGALLRIGSACCRIVRPREFNFVHLYIMIKNRSSIIFTSIMAVEVFGLSYLHFNIDKKKKKNSDSVWVFCQQMLQTSLEIPNVFVKTRRYNPTYCIPISAFFFIATTQRLRLLRTGDSRNILRERLGNYIVFENR